MSDIGKPERVTQDRVVALFEQQLHYSYLGDWSDRVAFGITRGLRFLADTFFAKRYGNRAIVLETVAAVPGMDYPSSGACAPFVMAFAPAITGHSAREISGRPFKRGQPDTMFNDEGWRGTPAGTETDNRT